MSRRGTKWAAMASLAGMLTALLAALPAGAAGSTYTASWRGQTVRLDPVPNPRVEPLTDAWWLGQLTGFRTDNPHCACLGGQARVVWTAPQEFPEDHVVPRGGQGARCVTVTPTVAQPGGSGAEGSAPPIPSPTAGSRPLGGTVPVVGSGFGPAYSGNAPGTGGGFCGPSPVYAAAVGPTVSWNDTQIVAVVPAQGVPLDPARIEVWHCSLPHAGIDSFSHAAGISVPHATNDGIPVPLAAAATAAVAAGPGTAGSPPTAFADVDDVPWAVPSIALLQAQGVVRGVSPTAFAPDSPLTGEEAITFLSRLFLGSTAASPPPVRYQAWTPGPRPPSPGPNSRA